MDGVSFPGPVKLALVVGAAGIAYAQSQTSLHLEAVWTFGLGLAQVVIATLLAAQGTVTRAVRQLRARPYR